MANIITISKKDSENINNFYQKLIALGYSIDKVIVFGSYIKGTAKSYSDIDLGVVSNDFKDDQFDHLVNLNKISVLVDPKLEPHPFHPDDLKDKWNPLAREVVKYGIEWPRPGKIDKLTIQ